MRWTRFIPLSLLLLNLQVFPFSHWIWQGAGPNFLLVLMMFCVTVRDSQSGLICAFALGLLMDLNASMPLGSSALLFTLLALPLNSLREALNMESFPDIGATAFVISFLYGAGLLIVEKIMRPDFAPDTEYALLQSLKASTCTALAAMILAPLLRYCVNFFHPLPLAGLENHG